MSRRPQLGAEVSQRIRARYGVVQNQAAHRYVALVGTALAQVSSRPDLAWKFIVLDTDAVNAFAAPGGFVHITKGALANLKSESELAGVLGHENHPRDGEAHHSRHPEGQVRSDGRR